MKKLAGIIATVAMLATGAASLGCVWWLMDEPESMNLFND